MILNVVDVPMFLGVYDRSPCSRHAIEGEDCLTEVMKLTRRGCRFDVSR